jgi:AraC-like DNA-binding protein
MTRRTRLTSEQWERLAKQANFDPTQMALLLSISERHLQRIFKQHFLCTPSRWMLELRCHLAKQLISKGITTKAAAAQLKFANSSHFCRAFKRIFGVSPQFFSPGEC